MRPLPVLGTLLATLLAVLALAPLSGADGAHATSFDSGSLRSGATWSHTFNATGTFPYRCTYHANMDGTLVVDENATVNGTAMVRMLDNRFDPVTLTVKPGTVVTWVNEGHQPHNAVGGDSANDRAVPFPALAGLAGAVLVAVALLRARRA